MDRTHTDDRDERGYTVAELWAAARRRARPAAAVFAAVAVGGAAVVVALPNEYRARAVIILEPYRPHAELVVPAVTTLLEDRLRVARQQILARPLLARVVEAHDLYPELRRRGPDAAVAKLRADVEVRPDGEAAIEVAYRTRQPGKAAAVVSDLARGFVEANAQLRTGQARRLAEILNGEMNAVQSSLAAQDAKVQEFRHANDGRLPEQVEANLREAERASRLLDSSQGYVRDLSRRRALLPVTGTRAPEVERLAAVRTDVERQLNHARAAYLPGHPETARLEREVAGLRELQRQAAERDETQAREKAAYDRELRGARAEAAELQARIAQARESAAGAAQVAAQLGVLQRDRDLLAEKYRSLLSRKVESEVTLALEEKDAPTATRVVDPAEEPREPSAPERARLLLVVLALAAMAAAGAGVVLESRDTTLRTPARARAELGIPVLAAVPSLAARH